jgi:hypothetical protein
MARFEPFVNAGRSNGAIALKLSARGPDFVLRFYRFPTIMIPT